MGYSKIMKGVVNSVTQSGLSTDLDGLHTIHLDIRYTCAEFGVILQKCHDILFNGTKSLAENV